MGAIKVHEFISLDGIVENPTWTLEFGFDPAMGEALADTMAGCRAILLGRITYEMFAPVWSSRTVDDDPGAPFFNETDKYVVASRPSAVDWAHTSILGSYDARTIRALKDSVDGDIYVSGSITLVQAMLADGLVDRLELFMYPVVLGTGLRLFPDGSRTLRADLDRAEAYRNGVVHLSYQPTVPAH